MSADENKTKSNFVERVNDIALFGRRVSGSKTMGQGADIACATYLSELTACQREFPGQPSKCEEQRLEVLACRGIFLCPAVAEMWKQCHTAEKTGLVKPGSCEQERKALEICMECNSTE
mmetsp:Transcript_30979/g.75985  ORF Transcript_30979/g.75985 Transcript_30979/m.75985 type:complete len:119 (-) Transcript_30979:1110-1466(-)